MYLPGNLLMIKTNEILEKSREGQNDEELEN